MLRDLFNLGPKNELVEVTTPRKTFADVVLPETTRRQLYDALIQIDKHRLIYSSWGLGERHQVGTGLVFNFAGPPGTGKTICAEAVAKALGRKLCRVRYSELESMWAGQTGKNVTSVFRDARANDAVLFFDEADSIAARRFTSISFGYEREANQSVNILLKELEEYEGVVIFATNLASNVDPAFERRIRTHILFEMPGPAERERIWHVQLHPQKTPIADDVDFRELAERYPVSGGDIKNAVLLAAQMAAGEEGPDEEKRIHQRHFVAAMERVRDARKVTRQNMLDDQETALDNPWATAAAEARFAALDTGLSTCREELLALAAGHQELAEQISSDLESLRSELAQATAQFAAWRETSEEARARQAQAWEARLAECTLIPWARWRVVATGVVAGLLMLVAGLASGHFLHW
jgi:MoxR-like ATPase